MNRYALLTADDDCIIAQINAKALCDRLKESITAAGVLRRLIDALRPEAEGPGDARELDGSK